MLGVGGTVVARARAILEVDTHGFDRGIKQAEKGLKKWNRMAVKESFVVLGAFGLASKKWIEAARDNVTTINKVSRVFGENAKEVVEWSKDSATAMGISQTSALAFASQFGNMLKPMGFVKGEAASMSTALVKLAADMGSFNNVNPTKALEALESALARRVKPIRKLGVFLTDARVQAEALSSGMVHASVDMTKVKSAQLEIAVATAKHADAVKQHGANSMQAAQFANQQALAEARLQKAIGGQVPKLTDAQKALATYRIILQDTKIQQGDFAKSADTAANREQTVAAQTANLNDMLGKALLPTYRKFLSVSISVLGSLEKHGKETKIVIGAVVGLSVAVIAVNLAWKVYEAALRAATIATMIANNAMRATIIGALITLAIVLVTAYEKSATFRRIVKEAFTVARKVVADAVWAITRQLDLFLHGLELLAEGASHLPLIGGKFKGVAAAIGEARDKLNSLDDAIRGTNGSKVHVDVEISEHLDQIGAAHAPKPTEATKPFTGAVHVPGGGKVKIPPMPTFDPNAALAQEHKQAAAESAREARQTAAEKARERRDAARQRARDKRQKERERKQAAHERSLQTPQRLLLREAKARGTKGLADDLAVAKAEKSWVRRRIRQGHVTLAELTGLYNDLADQKDKVAGIESDIADKRNKKKGSSSKTKTDLAAQLASARFDFLGNRQSFISSFASNMFGVGAAAVGGGAGPSPTVIVNQSFPAPTSDKHREAAYARRAFRSVMEGAF